MDTRTWAYTPHSHTHAHDPKIIKSNWKKKTFCVFTVQGHSPLWQGRHGGRSTWPLRIRERWTLRLSSISPFSSAQDSTPWHGSSFLGVSLLLQLTSWRKSLTGMQRDKENLSQAHPEGCFHGDPRTPIPTIQTDCHTTSEPHFHFLGLVTVTCTLPVWAQGSEGPRRH